MLKHSWTTAHHGVHGYDLKTFNVDLSRATLPVKPCDELTLLGTKLRRDGSSNCAVDYRMEKAEKAMMANYELLIKRNAPLVKRFAEYCKRVVPILLHGAGSWSWSVNLFWRLHKFEGKCLGRMLGWVKVSDDEGAQNNWWSVRISRARQIFVTAGFEPIGAKCLRNIFHFSLRVPNISVSSSALRLVSRCLTWRNQTWWKHREGMGDNRLSRLHPGRPSTRWEDIFVSYLGINWSSVLCSNVDGWKSRQSDFIAFGWGFASSKYRLKNGEDKQVVHRHLKHCKSDDNPIDQDEAILPFQFTDKNFARIELIGDSNLIVNWANANWPCMQRKQQEIVDDAIKTFHSWFHEFGFRPRCDYNDWCRHVRRSLNTDCDSLAGKAKTMTENDLLLDLKVVPILGLNIVAKWDGGYTPGESFVTVGFFH